MSEASSRESADSTRDSHEPATSTLSFASPTSGGEGCLPPGSPECPSTRMSETWQVAHENFGGKLYISPEVPALMKSPQKAPFIYLQAASPAKTSALPAAAPDSKPENDPASSSSSPDVQTSLFQPEGGSWSRTYPDFFPPSVAEISRSFSRRWPSSGFTTSPGECWTADTSECPSGGGVSSSLADVLQDDVPSRYFLSPRAAAGILRRAEKRGRELPAHLAAALEAVAGRRMSSE